MNIAVIVGMALITFLLRFTPLLLTRDFLPKTGKIKMMLDHLPLAVLSALTVPGIFQVDPKAPLIGIASGAAAVILVLVRKIPLLLVVLGAVTAAVIVKVISLNF
ncbi:AzlD domain-containing protein [Paenibacillus sp. FSL L8-0470]|uniref:AzlD domain-containing protein n=1 Tax=unclassified Paenibacillus TaxID=185978 RepID=UPI0030FB6B7A